MWKSLLTRFVKHFPFAWFDGRVSIWWVTTNPRFMLLRETGSTMIRGVRFMSFLFSIISYIYGKNTNIYKSHFKNISYFRLQIGFEKLLPPPFQRSYRDVVKSKLTTGSYLLIVGNAKMQLSRFVGEFYQNKVKHKLWTDLMG